MLCLTETQICENDMITHFQELPQFAVFLNNNADKYSSLAFLYRNTLEVLPGISDAGLSAVNVIKQSFQALPIKVLLLYRKNSLGKAKFVEALTYFVRSRDPDIILGDFNIDHFHKEEKTLSFLMDDYEQIVNRPTHISGSLLDHVYIKKILFETFNVSCTVEAVYFSDHDAVKIVLSKLE